MVIRMRRLWFVILAFVLATLESFGATLTATPSNFGSVFASAQGGDIILLAPGNYGSFNGGSKSGMVTVQPNAGAGGTQSNVVFGSLNLGASQNLTFQNMTIGGATVGTGSSPGMHIHFVGDT